MYKTNNSKQNPAERIKTKLKFTKSETTGAFISFISQNPKTGRICGVRQDSPYPKKICFLKKGLEKEIIPNALYDVVIYSVPDKNTYIIEELAITQFEAHISTAYVPKAVYMVAVKFGNKTIIFDPLSGKNDCVKTIKGCMQVLEKRVDIANLTTVLEDFSIEATALMKRFEKDGFYVKKS